MRRIYLFLLVSLISLNFKAQTKNPTYEETVNYIIQNTKGRVMYPGDLDSYSRVEGYHLNDVKIEKNGKIEFVTNQKNKSYGYNNNFSIIFNIFDLVEKVDYPDGIRAYKFLVHFNGLNVSKGYGITYATDADAQKVARALRYLKTLCKKDDDIFSQPTEVEKKSNLTKEETVDYINKKLKETKFENNKISLSEDCIINYELYSKDTDLPYEVFDKMRVKKKFNDYSDDFNYGSTNIGKNSSFNIKNIIDLTYLK